MTTSNPYDEFLPPEIETHYIVCGGVLVMKQLAVWAEGTVWRFQCGRCGLVGAPFLVGDESQSNPRGVDYEEI